MNSFVCDCSLDNPCYALARLLHVDYYVHGRYLFKPGCLPRFWGAFDNDVARLQRIYSFFCSLNPDVGDDRKIDPRVQEISLWLLARLKARRERQPPPPASQNWIENIRQVSRYQVERFRWLGPLLGPAFDAFAAGDLAPRVQPAKPDETDSAPPQPLVMMRTPIYPEPDGGLFFCWSEFAFAAIELDIDRQAWLEFLPILLRAQFIYIRAYGDPAGYLPKGWDFNSYNPNSYKRPIDPESVEKYCFGRLRDESLLKVIADECVRQAFPNGFDAEQAQSAVLARFATPAGFRRGP